jgi:hypothetical protein
MKLMVVFLPTRYVSISHAAYYELPLCALKLAGFCYRVGCVEESCTQHAYNSIVLYWMPVGNIGLIAGFESRT